MKKRLLMRLGLGAAALFILLGGGWIASLPPAPIPKPPPPIASEEYAANLAALRPPKRRHPLIAILGINDATEATDYLMPYGILRRADTAAARPSRGGLLILPDKVASDWPPDRRIPSVQRRPPAQVLEDTLRAIGRRYGKETSGIVAMQLEYPGDATRPAADEGRM